MELGIIDKAGSWYSYGDDRIGQGKEKVREFLLSNLKVAAEIEAKIRAILLPDRKEAENVPKPVAKEA